MTLGSRDLSVSKTRKCLTQCPSSGFIYSSSYILYNEKHATQEKLNFSSWSDELSVSPLLERQPLNRTGLFMHRKDPRKQRKRAAVSQIC